MAWSKSKLKSWNLVIWIEYQGEKSLIVTLILLEWVEAEQGEDEPADVEQDEVKWVEVERVKVEPTTIEI